MSDEPLRVETTGETVGEAKWAALRELEQLYPGLDKASVRFRETVEEVGGEITALPDDSFAVCGTSVRTCLVYLPGYAGGPLRTHDWLNQQPRHLDLFARAER